jgi:hypothetical protein
LVELLGVAPGWLLGDVAAWLPGMIPTLTLLFAALQVTPPTSPGLTPSCTSNTALLELSSGC